MSKISRNHDEIFDICKYCFKNRRLPLFECHLCFTYVDRCFVKQAFGIYFTRIYISIVIYGWLTGHAIGTVNGFVVFYFIMLADNDFIQAHKALDN